MPSSPNYKRDIKQETATALARGERQKNIERKRARRLLEKEGKVHVNDGLDVDHKKPLSKGGSIGEGNLRVKTASANRSFARTKTGSIK